MQSLFTKTKQGSIVSDGVDAPPAVDIRFPGDPVLARFVAACPAVNKMIGSVPCRVAF